MAEETTTADAQPDAYEWLEGLAGGGPDTANKLGVWKHREGHRGQPIYLQTEVLAGTPAEMLDLIRHRYGGGDFRLQAFGPKTKSHPSSNYGTVDVTISGQGKMIPAGELEQPKESKSELELLRTQLEEERAKRQELENKNVLDRVEALARDFHAKLEEMRQPPPQADNAPIMTMFAALMENMTRMLTLHLQTPVKGTNGLELLPAILGMFQQGVEMGHNIGAGEVSGGGYMDVLRQLSPAINAIAAKVSGEPVPDTVTVQPQPSGEESPAMPPSDFRSAFKLLAPRLALWARSGSSPYVRADQTLEDLPPNLQESVAEFLQEQGGSPLTTLLTWNPELAAYRPWLETYIERIRSDIFEDAQEAPATDNPSEE